ncbi:hypothetical protein C8F04DRAFT_631062 [Mycena alexandri]|uniref:NAD-dependent epimerase/dehydratase domain-containing protein n=1 Tax=Mycena alexandri TaxID=1745969 RepID=A0AAD6SWM3_9AGAR|nr:hypothetical protein C8F04DRAFT_631062 [Mycena alexandri]
MYIMNLNRPDLVVVTGGTGHVGSMVIDQLLKGGYSVRATARPSKIESLKSTYPNANGKLEIFEMADMLSDAGKWPEILQRADAIIHIACPVYHPGTTSEYIYSVTNEGTQKLLDAVGKSSVKRFVLTCSIGAFFKPDFSSVMDKTVYDHNTWSEIEDIDPKEHIPSYTYIASKTISEKLVWKAAEKYPHIDFTSILPSTIYGWRIKDYPVYKSIPELNANKFLHQFLEKDVTYPIVDVVHNHDVARAHVLALTAPTLPKGEKKRFIVSACKMTWVEAIQFLTEPEIVAKFTAQGHDIVARLPDISAPAEYITWKEILLEVVPNLIDWEKEHPEAL